MPSGELVHPTSSSITPLIECGVPSRSVHLALEPTSTSALLLAAGVLCAPWWLPLSPLSPLREVFPPSCPSDTPTRRASLGLSPPTHTVLGRQRAQSNSPDSCRRASSTSKAVKRVTCSTLTMKTLAAAGAQKSWMLGRSTFTPERKATIVVALVMVTAVPACEMETRIRSSSETCVEVRSKASTMMIMSSTDTPISVKRTSVDIGASGIPRKQQMPKPLVSEQSVQMPQKAPSEKRLLRRSNVKPPSVTHTYNRMKAKVMQRTSRSFVATSDASFSLSLVDQ
mmetsp:Transcript_41484/g.102362  ORF Transcript_41484/g.102362 Transcript_41484/m.102362 type:complete len:283 (-) Transcript_41484:835-1683(-)